MQSRPHEQSPANNNEKFLRSEQEAAKLEINQLSEYEKLSETEKAVLLAWIERHMCSATRTDGKTSYYYKHRFEESEEGFGISNGVFKGAMKAAGHKPHKPGQKNWTFPRIRYFT